MIPIKSHNMYLTRYTHIMVVVSLRIFAVLNVVQWVIYMVSFTFSRVVNILVKWKPHLLKATREYTRGCWWQYRTRYTYFLASYNNMKKGLPKYVLSMFCSRKKNDIRVIINWLYFLQLFHMNNFYLLQIL